MYSTRYIITCREAELVDDNLSCIGFFDEITSNEIPARLDTFFLVVGFDGLKKGVSETFHVAMRRPDQSYIFDRKFTLDSINDTSPVNYILKIRELPITLEGRHEFIVSHKRNVIARSPLIISLPKGGSNE